MPREIDCPDCNGKGETCTSECGLRMNLQAGTCSFKTCNWKLDCKNPNCKNGQITVYTEQELHETVQEWKDKLYNFLKGLEVRNISEFIEDAEKVDYYALGKISKHRIKDAIKKNRKNVL